MKKILCYGDSNTFGYVPLSGERYDETERWTCVLQSILGNEFKIIEEGACDRTGFVNNPKGYLFSGPRHFPKLISKASDVDKYYTKAFLIDTAYNYSFLGAGGYKPATRLINSYGFKGQVVGAWTPDAAGI